MILLPFLLISFTVALWALYLPNLYMSSTSIFIEPQRVPTEYVRSTITTDIESRLRTISQQLTSRTKLLKVIKQLDLYPEATAQGVPNETLVLKMRRNLTVQLPANSMRDASLFTVSFLHEDPTKAMLAVSNLVSMFIEESLQVRELQAEGTTTFIEEELEGLKKVLEKQEAAIQTFKSRHMGELPDQLGANLAMLDNLQIQLSDNLEAQREVENRILLLEQEVSRMQVESVTATTVTEGTEPVNTTLTQLIQQCDELSARVNAMGEMYTENHPDLIAAKRELTRIEASIRDVNQRLVSSTPRQVPDTGQVFANELNNLRRQLNENVPRLAALQKEDEELRKNIKFYKGRVEMAPVREQQLTQLTRDYENTKASYEDLLTKKMEAQMSENLEKRQKGEKFQVLDPANLPEKPHLPNRVRIILMGLAAGLGIGVGLALMLEMLNPVFYSIRQMQLVVEAPIVLGIPFIPSRRERWRTFVFSLLSVALFVVLVAGVLIYVDRNLSDLGQFAATIANNLRGIL